MAQFQDSIGQVLGAHSRIQKNMVYYIDRSIQSIVYSHLVCTQESRQRSKYYCWKTGFLNFPHTTTPDITCLHLTEVAKQKTPMGGTMGNKLFIYSKTMENLSHSTATFRQAWLPRRFSSGFHPATLVLPRTGAANLEDLLMERISYGIICFRIHERFGTCNLPCNW